MIPFRDREFRGGRDFGLSVLADPERGGGGGP
jgi:hypothetical protein